MITSFIRTVLLYIIILFSLRFMGKRQISELQTSELVVTLLISDIAAIPMQDTAQPLLSGVLPILVLVVCELFLSVLMLKHHRFRRLICGKPALVIRAGELQPEKLRELRMTVEDLAEQLRQKDIRSLQDVDYAVIEPNGHLSVVKKPEKDLPTVEQLGLIPEKKGIETVIVCDGIYSDHSLQICGKTRSWAEEVLQREHMTVKDVFLMTANTGGDYQIIKRGRSV